MLGSETTRTPLSLSSSRECEGRSSAQGDPRTGSGPHSPSRSYMSPHKRREAENTERQAKKGRMWQMQQLQQQIRLAHWQQQQSQSQDVDKDRGKGRGGEAPQSSLSPAPTRYQSHNASRARADTPSRYFHTSTGSVSVSGSGSARARASSLSPSRMISRSETASSLGVKGRGRGRGSEVEVEKRSRTACSSPSRAPRSSISPKQGLSSSLYQLSTLSPSIHQIIMKGGYSRQDVIDEKIKVPRYSVTQVRLLCGWLNSLHLWHCVIKVENIQTEVRTGVLLVRLVQTLDPHSVFINVTQRVMSAKPAIENIEQVLGNVLRTRKINTNRYCTQR